MKKSLSIICICLLGIILSSCRLNNNLENMTTKETSEYVSIVWGDKTYVPYCGISFNEMGDQIGLVDGNKSKRVYEYKEHSKDEWIILLYKSGELDTAMLLREEKTTDNLENLESEYEWNNK